MHNVSGYHNVTKLMYQGLSTLPSELRDSSHTVILGSLVSANIDHELQMNEILFQAKRMKDFKLQQKKKNLVVNEQRSK